MPISRGSIHHSIREDLWALFLSLLDKKSCEEASEKSIYNTLEIINKKLICKPRTPPYKSSITN